MATKTTVSELGGVQFRNPVESLSSRSESFNEHSLKISLHKLARSSVETRVPGRVKRYSRRFSRSP